jgi:lysophospholipase L1-like esterase
MSSIFSFLSSSASLFASDTPESGPIRYACIGDSITEGCVGGGPDETYPGHLKRMLGAGWDVRNFGLSGTTALRKGDFPYWSQFQLPLALEFRPQVVTIKLGTNDTKPYNWDHKADFVDDCLALIDRFQSLDTHPKIWLCTPAPAFPGDWGIDDGRIREEVIPLLEEVAAKKQLPIIDCYTPLVGCGEWFPDMVHPDTRGTLRIAETIYAALMGHPFETR